MIRTSICALLLAFPAPLLAASVPLTPEQQSQARRLVGQLGHPSFPVREQAGAQLVQLGRAVEPVLRQGLTSADLETRVRCRRLLPRALHYDLEKQIGAFLADKEDKSALPGWARFKQVAGPDEAARHLFVDMQRIDPEFMEALAANPESLREKFTNRCVDFMNTRNFGTISGGASAEEVAFLLFAALEPRATRNTAALSNLSGGLNSLSSQPAGKQTLRGNPAVRKMLVHFLLQTDSSAAYTNLYLVSNLELKEGVDITRNIIRSPNRDMFVRVLAIGLLGKIGGKEHAADIEPFLKDKTTIGSVRFGNGPQFSTQVRDVALAALIQLSGQPLTDYDFPYFKMMPGGANLQVHLQPTMFGFTDEASRNTALKKFNERREEAKK